MNGSHFQQHNLHAICLWTSNVSAPQILCRQRKNGGAQGKKVLGIALENIFQTLCENFDPRSSAVRSSGQVKAGNLISKRSLRSLVV